MAQQKPVRDVSRYPIVPVIMVIIATVEVLYEWASIFRRANRAVVGWWDKMEEREHQAAMRSGMRWIATRLDPSGTGTARKG
jgi:hypothetical protein